MQALAGIVSLLAMGFGFAAAGLPGALTGLTVSIGVGSGLAIFRAEGGTDVAPVGDKRRVTQRLGGTLAALGSGAGAYHGGWRFGWAWALAGYIAGMFAALLLAVLTGGLRSKADS